MMEWSFERALNSRSAMRTVGRVSFFAGKPMKIVAAVLMLAIAGPAYAARPPITGTYSSIVKSQASGDLYGYELRILKVDGYYYAVVIEENEAPELAGVTVAGHHIAFKAADQTWAGEVTAKGIDFKCPPGVTANCVQAHLPRAPSFWKQD